MMKNYRLSKRGGGTDPIEWGSQETAAHGGAGGRSAALKVPAKHRPFAEYPLTGVPTAAEQSIGMGPGPYTVQGTVPITKSERSESKPKT